MSMCTLIAGRVKCFARVLRGANRPFELVFSA
jgi:hypothetical protein